MNKRLIVLLALACIFLSGSQAQPVIKRHYIPPIIRPSTWYSPTPPPDFSFGGYNEYLDFFKNALPEALPDNLEKYYNDEIYGAAVPDEILAYREDVRSGAKKLLVPYSYGNPLTVEERPDYVQILLRDSNGYNGLFHIRFDCEYNGEFVEITLSELPEEYLEYASQMNCSEFIKALWPTSANLHNYYKCGCDDAAAQIINVGGKPTSVLYLHERDGDEVFHMILEGYWVKIIANDGVMTDDFLENFDLGVFAEDFV